MFVHIFAFTWQADAPTGSRERAVVEIGRFLGVMPGLQSIQLGENISSRSPMYSTTGIMVFEGQADYQAYCAHPAHLALLEWVVPLIDALELDFEVNRNEVD